MSSGENLKTNLLKSLPCFAVWLPGKNKECRPAMNYGRRAMEDIFDQLRMWLILGQVNNKFHRVILTDHIFFIFSFLFHLLGVGFGRDFCSLNSIHLIL